MNKHFSASVIARRVCVQDADRHDRETPEEQLLQDFDSEGAWVLLGEPGSGKSTSLEQAALIADGVYLSIAEFIAEELDPAWQGKTLFLDGLDEIRASSKNSDIPVIRRITARLKKLGSPPFRLSCRAADWLGSSDSEILQAVSPSKTIKLLQLEPLNDEELQSLLQIYLQQTALSMTPIAFVNKAEKLGLAELLSNPQTLKLVVDAVSSDRWPNNRHEAYRLACEKMAGEENRQQRDTKRLQGEKIYSSTERITAAGHLFAVMLLSDQAGFALDADGENDYFLSLQQCDVVDFEAAQQALHSKLFRPITSGLDRLVPCHRSVAEFLASQWLAAQVDNKRLPLTRLLNLLLGFDGRAVAGLRGLYSWLALHCKDATEQLIKADCLAVVLYGDPEPMLVEHKRQILWQLREVTDNDNGFGHYGDGAFGRVGAPELEDDLKTILTSVERDRVHQTHLSYVLNIVADSGLIPGLLPLVYQLVIDDSYWPGIRTVALRTWLKYEPKGEACIKLLNDIRDNHVVDAEDELAGMLLRNVYPDYLSPKALLTHLHIRKKYNLVGGYLMFWKYDLVSNTPDHYLPELMDALPVHSIWGDSESYHDDYTASFLSLLLRAVQIHGDNITDSRLLEWLQLRNPVTHHYSGEEVDQKGLFQWFKSRPDRYKALLSLCYQDTEAVYSYTKDKRNRLQYIPRPADLALWHYQQMEAASANEKLAKLHFEESFDLLAYAPESSVGLDFEMLINSAENNPTIKGWLEPLLTCEYPDWHTKNSIDKKSRQEKNEREKAEHTAQIEEELAEIEVGTACPHTMYLMAGIADKRFYDVSGDTVIERFNSYFNHSKRIHDAALSGLKRCPERDDIPEIDEIFKLHINSRQSYLHQACLLGMSLRYKDDESSVVSLPSDKLQKMIAFYLAHHGNLDVQWMDYLASAEPELVAEVFMRYSTQMLRSKKEYLNGAYEMEQKPPYQHVAKIAAPRILKAFPLRARADLHSYLRRLIRAAIRFAPEQTLQLLTLKLGKKSLSATQRVYWYAAGLMIDADRYEPALWHYIKNGDSDKKIKDLAAFFSNDFNEVDSSYLLPVNTLGRLIEALAPSANMSYDSEDSTVTGAMRQGDNIRRFLSRLEVSDTAAAITEIDRLLQLPVTEKVHYQLEHSRNELLNRQREENFSYFSVPEVVAVINNKAPANAADLLALASDTLQDIARDIRSENDNGYQDFWNIESGNKPTHRSEEVCRDALLRHLKYRLQGLGIDCQSEAKYTQNNRADIRLSYGADFELPIEIKGDWHSAIWRTIKQQLVEKYTVAPKSEGYGIYLVLWFGGEKISMAGGDGGKRPKSAEELQVRLEATIDAVFEQKIAVHAVDVSWPKGKP